MSDDASPTLPLRRPQLTFESTSGTWTPAAPDLSSVADALSLAMPFAEPCVVATIRDVVDELPPDLADRARSYAAQEAAHHGLHRRYNEVLRREGRLVAGTERVMGAAFRWLGRRSVRLRLAWVVGFESLAFAGARWFDPRADRLFAGAEPVRAQLFLWHLAEESEHRSVAFDVLRARKIGRGMQLAGLVLALLTLGSVGLLGTLALQTHRRRLLNPWAWCTIVWWTLSYTFIALPMAALSFTRDHDPQKFAEPATLPWWLARFDPTAGSLAPWDTLTS